MKEINLIPKEIAQEKLRRRQKLLQILLILLILVLTACPYLLVQSKIIKLEREGEYLDSMLESYAGKFDLKAKLTQQNEEIKKRLMVYDGLSKNRVNWCSVLKNLSKSVVDGMVLTEINSMPENGVKVCGEAEDNRSIASFMYLLNVNNDFENIRLRNIRQSQHTSKDSPGYGLYFELTFRLKRQDRTL